MPRPQKYDKSVRDGLISDTAATIAEVGINAVSLRTLAHGRGLSTTAIYTLFGSKNALIAETAAAAIDSFARSQEDVSPNEKSLDHLDSLGRAYREWALEHQALYRLVFGGRLYDAATSQPPKEVSARRAMQPLQHAIERLLAEGLFKGDALTVSTMLWSCVHGFVTLEMGPLQGVPRHARDAMFESMLTIANSGCMTTPGRSSAD